MSHSTPSNERGTAPAAPSLPAPLRAGAFWLAILLPFCSVALLSSGLDTTTEHLLFAALVVVNVVALIVGHGHGQ